MTRPFLFQGRVCMRDYPPLTLYFQCHIFCLQENDHKLLLLLYTNIQLLLFTMGEKHIFRTQVTYLYSILRLTQLTAFHHCTQLQANPFMNNQRTTSPLKIGLGLDVIIDIWDVTRHQRFLLDTSSRFTLGSFAYLLFLSSAILSHTGFAVGKTTPPSTFTVAFPDGRSWVQSSLGTRILSWTDGVRLSLSFVGQHSPHLLLCRVWRWSADSSRRGSVMGRYMTMLSSL